MTFEYHEFSNFEGDPLLLYEFHRTSGGAEFYWRYTTHEADVAYGGNNYVATAISDSGVRQTGETASSDLVVTMPVVDDLPAMFRTSGSSPSDTVFLTVRRGHIEIIWSSQTNNSFGTGAVVVLASGASLFPGDSVSFGGYTYTFQMDGNVVLTQGATVLGESGTAGSGATALTMQADGNLVLYAGETVLFQSFTDGNPGSYFILQGDGNLVIYGVLTRVVWVGTLSGMTQPDEVQVKITCATLVASFKRGGLRLSWTRGCPHALYDSQCKVNPNDFNMVVEVIAHTGNTLTAIDLGTQADGWWSGGFIEWSLPSGIMERRAITEHAANVITVIGNIFGLNDGDTVNVFPGCLRTTADCNTKFNNLVNYGGFPHIPGKSPFSGDAVF